MKRIVPIFLVLILISLGFIANKTIANDKISQDNIKKIEEETQACLDEGIAMHSCNYNAINKYEIEIEKILKKIKKQTFSISI